MVNTEKPQAEAAESGEKTSSLNELAIRHRASVYLVDDIMPVVTACSASPTTGGITSREKQAAGLLRKRRQRRRRAPRVRRRRRD